MSVIDEADHRTLSSCLLRKKRQRRQTDHEWLGCDSVRLAERGGKGAALGPWQFLQLRQERGEEEVKASEEQLPFRLDPSNSLEPAVPHRDGKGVEQRRLACTGLAAKYKHATMPRVHALHECI